MTSTSPIKIIIIILSCGLLNSCSPRHDSRLVNLNTLIETDPYSARDSIAQFSSDGLGERDASYFKLLQIKSSDKVYLKATSDSLIRDVLDYYSSHKTDPAYPDALYYAGRVYSDLGDYPSALNYFQAALEALPETAGRQSFRSTVLSQTGRLFNTIRLYDEATAYVKKAIKIKELLGDSLKLMYDNQLLGDIYLRQKKYDDASPCFTKALQLAKSLHSEDSALIQGYIAALDYHKGNISQALNEIRPALEHIDSISRNWALGYAAHIYLEAGIFDTAYIYGRLLIDRNEQGYCETGYQILLSDSLIKNIPTDSVVNYVQAYRDRLINYLNKNEAQAALMQSSLYNYSYHEREKNKAQRQKIHLQYWLIGIVGLSCCTLLLFAYFRVKSTRTLLRLRTQLDEMNRLHSDFLKKADDENESTGISDISSVHRFRESTTNKKELQEQLREKVIEIFETGIAPYGINEELQQSSAFRQLTELIADQLFISPKSALWEELDQVVNRCYPGFKERLQLLSGNKLKNEDYHLVLLIKCEVTPTQMVFLIGKAKGTISYRREALSQKLFGRNLGAKATDSIIRLL